MGLLDDIKASARKAFALEADKEMPIEMRSVKPGAGEQPRPSAKPGRSAQHRLAAKKTPGSSSRSLPDNLDEFDAIYYAHEGGMNSVYVVGESYRQTAISKVTGRKGSEAVEFDGTALLLPDWVNQDRPESNAIAVFVGGEHVAYLATAEAMRYRPAVEAAMRLNCVITCDAQIYARPPERANTPNAGVFIYLPEPEEIIASVS